MFLFNFSVNFKRNASFLSKKTAEIIKNIIAPPARVSNSYSLFFAENFSQFKGSDQKVTEISKIIAQKWKNLNENEKKIYSDKAGELKHKHDSEKESFVQNLNEKQKLALKVLNMNRRAEDGKVTRRELSAKQKDFLKSLPEGLPTSARGVFMSQRLKGVSGKNGELNSSLAGAMKEWSNMSAQQQQPFITQAEKNLASYKADLANFLKH